MNSNLVLGAQGGTFNAAVDVNAPACGWKPTSKADWIKPQGGKQSGDGDFDFVLEENATGSPRVGRIKVASGGDLKIRQLGKDIVEAPETPRRVTVRRTKNRRTVRVSWSNVDGETGFRIASPSLTRVTIVPANTRRQRFGKLALKTEHCFRVSAFNDAGVSPSKEDCVFLQ